MKKIIAEKMWDVIAPILVVKKGGRGRPEFDVRKAFFGILYVLENGIKWRCLPAEFGKVTTVHGKFIRWIRNGTLKRLFQQCRDNYWLSSKAFKNWYSIDTSMAKAPYAFDGGKNPTDRGKRGVKKNIIVDSQGAPMLVDVAPANRHDAHTFLQMLLQMKPILKTEITILTGDSAYHSAKLSQEAVQYGIVLHTSQNRRRSKTVSAIRPVGRWVIERTHSWLNNFRAVKTCYAKLREVCLAFLHIAASVLLFRMS